MTSLEKEIAYLKSKGNVIIQGDFNARTGHEQDLGTFSKYFENENDVTTRATNSHDRCQSSGMNIKQCHVRIVVSGSLFCSCDQRAPICNKSLAGFEFI